jgi:hypothetical protein
VDWYSSAEEAEPEAMKEGIFLTLNWVAGPVVCETDCAEVVEAINSQGGSRQGWPATRLHLCLIRFLCV